MTTEPQENGNWNLLGWYGPPALWIGLFVASQIVDCFSLVVYTADNVATLSGTEAPLVVALVIATGAAFQLIVWGIWTLPVWRRWIHAGTKRKNYLVWTCIHGGLLLIEGLVLAVYTARILRGSWANQEIGHTISFICFLGSISFLLRIANAIMIPKRFSHPAAH